MPKGEFEFTWFRHANGAREGKDTSSSLFFLNKDNMPCQSFAQVRANIKRKVSL